MAIYMNLILADKSVLWKSASLPSQRGLRQARPGKAGCIGLSRSIWAVKVCFRYTSMTDALPSSASLPILISESLGVDRIQSGPSSSSNKFVQKVV